MFAVAASCWVWSIPIYFVRSGTLNKDTPSLRLRGDYETMEAALAKTRHIKMCIGKLAAATESAANSVRQAESMRLKREQVASIKKEKDARKAEEKQEKERAKAKKAKTRLGGKKATTLCSSIFDLTLSQIAVPAKMVDSICEEMDFDDPLILLNSVALSKFMQQHAFQKTLNDFTTETSRLPVVRQTGRVARGLPNELGVTFQNMVVESAAGLAMATPEASLPFILGSSMYMFTDTMKFVGTEHLGLPTFRFLVQGSVEYLMLSIASAFAMIQNMFRGSANGPLCRA